MTATKLTLGEPSTWDTDDRYDANGILTTKAAFARLCDITAEGGHEAEHWGLCKILRDRGVSLDWEKLRNHI
jgi:hypothetical protein